MHIYKCLFNGFIVRKQNLCNIKITNKINKYNSSYKTYKM